MLSIYRFIPWLFFLIFIICSGTIYAVTDTTHKKQQYDLNDPRNPDCPCHKYQKLAEEEYAHKNQQIEVVSGSSESKTYNNEIFREKGKNQIQDGEKDLQKDIRAVDSIGSYYSTIEYPMPKNSLRKYHHKKNVLITKIRFRLYIIGKKIWKIKVYPNNCLCYKWHRH